MKYILIFITCCLFLSCSYISEKKNHQHIIDSLSKFEVPKYFDTVFFKKNAILDQYIVTTPEGIEIAQFLSRIYAYRMEVHHIDSIFRKIYEYDEKGRIVEYYQEFIRSYHDDNAIGYRIEYDTLGNVSGYMRDIPPVPFDIYDIVSLLQKENVNIRDSAYIAYRRDSHEQPYFWDVTITYKYNDIEYNHVRYFDPLTGKIIKEWTE